MHHGSEAFTDRTGQRRLPGGDRPRAGAASSASAQFDDIDFCGTLGDRLIFFPRTNPGSITKVVTLTDLKSGDRVVGLDSSPGSLDATCRKWCTASASRGRCTGSTRAAARARRRGAIGSGVVGIDDCGTGLHWWWWPSPRPRPWPWPPCLTCPPWPWALEPLPEVTIEGAAGGFKLDLATGQLKQRPKAAWSTDDPYAGSPADVAGLDAVPNTNPHFPMLAIDRTIGVLAWESPLSGQMRSIGKLGVKPIGHVGLEMTDTGLAIASMATTTAGATASIRSTSPPGRRRWSARSATGSRRSTTSPAWRRNPRRLPRRRRVLPTATATACWTSAISRASRTSSRWAASETPRLTRGR